MYCLIVKYGLEISFYAGSFFVDMYVKCGFMEIVSEFFYFMFKWSVVFMNILIGGYV